MKIDTIELTAEKFAVDIAKGSDGWIDEERLLVLADQVPKVYEVMSNSLKENPDLLNEI